MCDSRYQPLASGAVLRCTAAQGRSSEGEKEAIRRSMPGDVRFALRWRFGAVWLLLLIALIPSRVQARFGSWQCTTKSKVVSRGDFRSHRFAPVLSPRMRAFRWSSSLHYLNNLTCIYQLRVPFGHHIYYELPTFDLHPDCRGDRVVITGGDRTRRSLCGSARKLLHPYGVIRSYIVRMTFTTDATGTSTGFSGFFAAFKPTGGMGTLSALAKAATKRAKREAEDDDDEYFEPKTTIGEINLQQMRVLTGQASLDSYCRSMKLFGWELATASCRVQADTWNSQPRGSASPHLYRPNANTLYDSAVRSLSRRSVDAEPYNPPVSVDFASYQQHDGLHLVMPSAATNMPERMSLGGGIHEAAKEQRSISRLPMPMR